MLARFDENPAMTLQDIKETKCYGRTDARTDGQRENSIPTTNKVCGGYKRFVGGIIIAKNSIKCLETSTLPLSHPATHTYIVHAKAK